MRRFAVPCLLALALLGLATSAQADLIFFNDGFGVQGRLQRAGYLTREFDGKTVLELLRGHPHLQDDYMPPRPTPKAPPVVKDKGKADKNGKDDKKDKDEKKDKYDKKDKGKDEKKEEPVWPDK